MEDNILSLPAIVQRTLLTPDLATKKPWHHNINWVDQLCAIVSIVPIVGGSIATEIKTITESATDYRTNEFLRKFVRFLYGLDKVSDSERLKFMREVEEKAADASGNVMLSIIDRLDNINKQTILANIVRAKCEGDISIEEFFRLESVLQRIPYVDLAKLPLYQTEYYDDDGDTELLFSTGVLRPVVYHSEGNKFILSPLGVSLLKWGLEITVNVPEIRGTSTGLEWEVIGDDVY